MQVKTLIIFVQHIFPTMTYNNHYYIIICNSTKKEFTYICVHTHTHTHTHTCETRTHVKHTHTHTTHIPYSSKLSRQKTFVIFVTLNGITKLLFMNI